MYVCVWGNASVSFAILETHTYAMYVVRARCKVVHLYMETHVRSNECECTHTYTYMHIIYVMTTVPTCTRKKEIMFVVRFENVYGTYASDFLTV